MKYSNFKYLVKQGLSNFKENRLMSVASVGVVCSCLIIIGVCGLISFNVNSFASYLGTQNEFIVFLKDDISQESFAAMEKTIQSNDMIKGFRYVSKEDGLKEQMGYMGEFTELLEGYVGENNPISASFRCTLEDLTKLSEVTKSIAGMDGVDSVASPTELAQVLITIKDVSYYGGLTVLGILIFVSIVVISNTIRLTVFARRKEINIMKFVGATNSFIRLPFIVEGVVIGSIAALITFIILSGGYIYLFSYINSQAQGWIKILTLCMLPYSNIWYYMLLSFLFFGCFIGAAGSAISMKRYMNV